MSLSLIALTAVGNCTNLDLLHLLCFDFGNGKCKELATAENCILLIFTHMRNGKCKALATTENCTMLIFTLTVKTVHTNVIKNWFAAHLGSKPKDWKKVCFHMQLVLANGKMLKSILCAH